MSYFVHLRICFFIFQNEIVKFKKFVIFFIWKMLKFLKFNNLENLENFIIWRNYQILWMFKEFEKIIIKNKFINKIIK